MNFKFNFPKQMNLFFVLVLFQCALFLNTVNCQLDGIKDSANSKSLDNTRLVNVLNFLPQSIRESARNYIAQRMRRVAMYPIDKNIGNKNEEKKEILVRQPMMGVVPIIPEGEQTPKWVPGELIASQITKRQLRLIDESMYGPLKSATMFPSVMSTILVFHKRYDPERLAEVLKFNFGIESEPNGMILELS